MPSLANEESLHPHAWPLLSIIIPSLEPTAELRRCVASIEAAFAGDLAPEIIVVTPERFVAQIRSSYPGICVLGDTRRGIYAAMNDGAHASRGRFLYFLGTDDIVLPSMRNAAQLLQKERPFALSCDVYWGSRGVYSGKPSRLRLLARNLCHQGILYSREAFDKHGPYVRRLRVQADHLLNIKVLWDHSNGRQVRYFREPIVWYSGDGFSSTTRDPLFWRLYPSILRRFVGRWSACLLTVYRSIRGR